MSTDDQIPLSQESSENSLRTRVNLGWLLRLRWVGCLGAVLLLLVAQHLARLELEYLWLLPLWGIAVLSNVAAQWWLWVERERKAREDQVLWGILLLDTLLLTFTLQHSGGFMNPLVLGYVVLLVVGSATLSSRKIWGLCATCAAGLLVVAVAHRPLRADHVHSDHVHHTHEPHHHGLDHHDPSDEVSDPTGHAWAHVRSQWLALLVLGVLVVYLVRWALSQREAELRVLRAERERNLRLSELYTLAASAAHELGTPLATISVVANSLERALSRGAKNQEPERLLADVKTIAEQVARCRKVLDNMANDARSGLPEPAEPLVLGELLEQARSRAPEPRNIALDLKAGAAQSEALLPRRALLQVLQSLLENAHEASPGAEIQLCASVTQDHWRIEVIDYGGGLAEEVKQRWGSEPYSTKPHGMGIGLFLGKAILERLNGTLELLPKENGTCSVLTLARQPQEPSRFFAQ